MKCKKIIDARKFTHQALEEMRISAVRRVEAGESPELVASGLGVNRRTIYKWLSAYHYGGEDALKSKPIPGAPPKLSGPQMQEIARIIREDDPRQMRLPFALWTLALIRTVILTKFGISLTEVSVGRIMKRLGFSPQRPLYRACQQDKALVDQWREEEFPKIKKRAEEQGALIFFGDEAGIRSDYHAGTTWAPLGNTPVVIATGARFGLNMISAVNSSGHFRFMIVDGTVTGIVFRDFLQRLIAGIDRKIFLIVDGHPIHKAKVVKDFVTKHSDRIELFFLPPYSPELNPDELAWAHIKTRIAKKTVQTKEELRGMVISTMHRLQKLPKIVSSFFQAPTCKYAAL